MSPPSAAAGGLGGVEQSTSRAVSVFTVGCEANNGDACAEGARILLAEAVDASKAAAPGAGAGAGAAAPATDGAPAPVVPPRLPPEAAARVSTAVSLLQRGCDGGDGSIASARCCGMLGAVYLNRGYGAGAPPGGGAAILGLLERACVGEQKTGCFNAAALLRAGAPPLGIAADPARAADFTRRGLLLAGLSERRADAVLARGGDPTA
jgi:hypothetical protein